MRSLRLCVMFLSIVGSTAVLLNAQSTSRAGNPHLPQENPVSGVEQLVVIDDMLLWPEQLEPEPERNRRQAHPISYTNRLGTWDFGVIPYQIAPEFSDAERQRILTHLARWAEVAPLFFVARTTQSGYLNITRDAATSTQPSACFSGVGQSRRGLTVRTNIGPGCQSDHTVSHELGHAVGFWHEHQRSDRDNYLTIDFDNIRENASGNFNKISGIPLVGDYDFGSIMHYRSTEFAADTSRPVIVPHASHQQWATTMGTFPNPSNGDHEALAFLYNQQLRESTIRTPTEPVRTTFDRGDMLLAMERLHAFYMSRFGLQRPQGLSSDGRPDFLGLAQWIFDIYLPARSSGFSAEGAFDIVVASITQSEEWRQKNRGRSALTPAAFNRYINLNRDEFLDVMVKLDQFYAAPEGLQRPAGLSIAGGPDFLGIAAWIFDIYLNERLRGTSPNAAWVLTQNAIRATDEWRSKH